MEDYSWVTNEAFDKKLAEIMDRHNGEALLQVEGAHAAFCEHFNNQVLEELEQEREGE